MEKGAKFAGDLIWNYASTIFLAISGFLFSVIIALFYDEAILGIFNQVYAYYILLSQIAAFGVHLALTRYAAMYTETEKTGRELLSSALCAVACTSIATMGIAGMIYVLFWTQSSVMALRYIWLVFPALPLFSFNKVILGYLNGRSRMKAYAVFQAVRNALIAIFILLMAIFHCPGEYLAVAFFLTEVILFITMMIFLLGAHLFGGSPRWSSIRELLRFGFWILPGNFVLELNSKTDILCLSILRVSDSRIGYYSFAALFIEGLYQLLVVLRRNINPTLTSLASQAESRASEQFGSYKRKISKLVYCISLPAAMAVVAAYVLLCTLLNRSDYMAAFSALCVVACSIAVTAKYIVFGNVLAQTGFPAQESLINIISVCSNFCLNLAFISILNILGAGIATACSYLIYAVVLKKIVRRDLHINL